jgi:uncharacterized DUF497 family protein
VPFEWDPDEDKANREEHGFSFDEVTELFTSGTDFLEIFDEDHSDEEDRFVAIGSIRAGLVVVALPEAHWGINDRRHSRVDR